jgi:dihydrodipicolinate synthase/N-acetylneuraminate lyase
VTSLEAQLYVALLGARTIVSATANVNPRAMKILRLVDDAAAAYKQAKTRESPQRDEDEETADAAGD